ncbi:MAG: hypothetical protein WDM96_02700 [Lacunisphaera sp.]
MTSTRSLLADQLVAGVERLRRGALAGADLHGTLEHGDLELAVRLGADVKLRAGDPDGTGGRLDEERPRRILADVEERLAAGEPHAALLSLELDDQGRLRVQLDVRAVGQGELLALSHGRGEVLKLVL